MIELVEAGVKTIILGTRVGDPHTDRVEHFQPSSANWPAFMRVNPILEWRHDQVWKFLRDLHLPYCSLYDEGYTSIGNTGNSVRNPGHTHFILIIICPFEMYYQPFVYLCEYIHPCIHVDTKFPCHKSLLPFSSSSRRWLLPSSVYANGWTTRKE